MEAVYGLMGVDRGVPEVWGSVYDVRELLDASVKLMDGRSPLEIELPGPLNLVKKPLLKAIKGTLVEKELQRNYDCLREAKKRGVVMTIGSDSFSFVTPYGTCSIEEMYEFVDKIGFTPVETITCATLNGAKMCHIEDETGSIEAGKCADLLVVNGDVAADIHVLNTDNMDVIMKDGWIVEAGTFGEANKYSA